MSLQYAALCRNSLTMATRSFSSATRLSLIFVLAALTSQGSRRGKSTLPIMSGTTRSLNSRIGLVHRLLTASIARGARVRTQLLESLHGVQVAEVPRDHVQHAEVREGLEVAPGVHVDLDMGREHLLVDGSNRQAVLESSCKGSW